MKSSIQIIFYTLKEANLYVASTNANQLVLPNIDLTKLDPTKTIAGVQHVLKKIHTEYTDLSFDWSAYKFIDIEIFNNQNEINLNIFYGVFVPHGVQLQNTHWINIENLLPQYSILRRLLCLI